MSLLMMCILSKRLSMVETSSLCLARLRNINPVSRPGHRTEEQISRSTENP